LAALIAQSNEFTFKIAFNLSKKRYSVYYSIQINKITKGPNTLD